MIAIIFKIKNHTEEPTQILKKVYFYLKWKKEVKVEINMKIKISIITRYNLN